MWEERFQWLTTFYPKTISCTFTFDEDLAHQIYAGADFILIPSRFEPCGLIQMLAMRFGTLPIAHNVGGLHDSIRDGYNGFLFSKYSSVYLEKSMNRGVALWRNDRKTYDTMVENALKTDFSWKKSAQEYSDLYQKMIDGLL
jgi:starch synthase